MSAEEAKAAELTARRKAADRSAKATQAAAQSMDASIFDYDNVYDTMAAERAVRTRQRSEGPTKKKARYIGQLQEAAKVRQIDFDRVYERQLLKEQAADPDLPSERFVTAAYKQQLQESRKWDAVDQRDDAVERKTTAEVAGMHSFYANLLTKNIAAGADVKTAALSSYTHGSRAHDRASEPLPPPVAPEPLPPPPETTTTPVAPVPAAQVEEKEEETAPPMPVADLKAQARARYLARKEAKEKAAASTS